MEPLILLIEPELDERAAAATMSRAQRVYEEGARDISRVMREQMTEGTAAAGKGFEDLETKARRAYLGMQDAGEKVAAAERKADAAREKGAANAETLARRVERARLDEIQAIERATAAYKDYEDATQNAGKGALASLRESISGAGQSGGDMANDFAAGFAGSSALMRLGAAGGPIGLALAGVAALGLTAGKVLADNIAAGLQSMQTRDLFQARLGVDDATMAQYGESAAKAYTDMWGQSVEDNLRAVQFGVQGGVIAPDASDAEIQQTIANLQALAGVMEVDVQEAARAAGQLMRGGFAADGTEAANIIATGFQNGLDISGDWLDTITEYTTQFRKLGLDGTDAIGLISQGLQGAARDSDVVADSLKEFSIRSVDGSKATAEGFAALGFDADEMAARFLAGGDSARQAFGVTLDAIRSLDDPIQQALTWQSLFGTQWEDMGDAINSMDLSTARNEFSNTEGAIQGMTDKLSDHTNGWDQLGRNIDTTFGKLQKWLADSAIGKFFSQGIPGVINDSFFAGSAADQAQAALEAAQAAAREQREAAATAPAIPGRGLHWEDGRGWVPDDGRAAPTPGARTPILTETQRAAQEAAKGGSESLPSAPSLPLTYTNTAGMPAAVASAQSQLDEALHSVAEKEARLNQLRQSNVADADDIQKAENDLVKAQQSQLKAEQSLNDARINATEQANKQLGKLGSDLESFGNELDSDFGISKGLGGIVENAVKALGNILAAPLLQSLGFVAKANPNEGSGLFGIAAANGAFGSQYTPAALAAASQSGTMPGYATSQGMTTGVPYGGPVGTAQAGESDRAFAHRVMMPFFQNQGFTVGDHAADKYGEHQNGALDIMVDSIAEGNAVLQQVLSDPNAYGAIFNNQTYGYGQGSSPRPYSAGNTGNPTQDHQDHVHVWYQPGGANNIAPTGSTWQGPTPSLPTSVPTSGSLLPGAGAPSSPVFASPAAPTVGVGGGLGQAQPGIPGVPGVGSALGQAQGPGVGLGTAYPSQGGNSGNILGGLALDGLMGAASGLDMMMPGAGAAAKIGIQVANRTIGYAAQNAGIAASGVMETLSLGDNPRGGIGNSWLGKLAGGLAGAAPAIPNIAGGKPPGPMDQKGGGQGQGGPVDQSQTNNVTVNNHKASEDQNGKVVAEHVGAMHAPAGRQP